MCEWTKNNNMVFNDKFQVISYSPKPDNTSKVEYHTEKGTTIKEDPEIKDLGVLMNNNMTFSSQIQTAVTKAKQKCGWTLRTFKSREKDTIMTLYKSLVMPHLEYCSVLIHPYKITDIQLMEGVQRSMTAKITAYKDYNYHERLKLLKMYSLQRRRDRYTAIYVWKIIEDLCPNLPMNPIETYDHIRKGRLCKVPPVNTKTPLRIQTIKENTLAVRGPRIFNSLPKNVREKSDIKVETFKIALDKYLATLRDEPPIPGYYTIDNRITNLQLRQTGPSSA